MPLSAEAAAAPSEALLGRIRPRVRAERAYRVAPVAVDVKLNQNESPYDLPEDLKQELAAAFAQIPFNRYPDDQPMRLVEAIAAHTGHDPEGILVGNGSNELTHTLGVSLIADGAKVVLPRPMFSLYGAVVRLFGGELVEVPPRDDLSFDAEAILAAVRAHQPTLTVLTTPNNPTGRAMPIEEIEPIVAAAEGFVLVDEAYVEFTDEVSAQTLLPRYPNLMLMRTLSKAVGLAGLRVGYLMAHPEVAYELLKARLPFMTDRLSETAALAVLGRPELLSQRAAQMKGELRRMVEALEAMPDVETVPTQANFVLVRTPIGSGELLRRLAERGILVRDMSGYPELRGYVRVGVGTVGETDAFLNALASVLSDA